MPILLRGKTFLTFFSLILLQVRYFLLSLHHTTTKRYKIMKTKIETLRKMQAIELEAGFPNGELYNELEDKINAIEAEAEKERRFGKSDKNEFDFADKSNPIHY